MIDETVGSLDFARNAAKPNTPSAAPDVARVFPARLRPVPPPSSRRSSRSSWSAVLGMADAAGVRGAKMNAPDEGKRHPWIGLIFA